jgi:hypothetical protein
MTGKFQRVAELVKTITRLILSTDRTGTMVENDQTTRRSAIKRGAAAASAVAGLGVAASTSASADTPTTTDEGSILTVVGGNGSYFLSVRGGTVVDTIGYDHDVGYQGGAAILDGSVRGDTAWWDPRPSDPSDAVIFDEQIDDPYTQVSAPELDDGLKVVVDGEVILDKT